MTDAAKTRQREPLLQLSELTKRYGAATVVDSCTVDFRSGEIHSLLGANGAGKSTLARMIAGLVSPSAGSMTLRGMSRSSLASEKQQAKQLQSDSHSYAPSNKREAEQAGIQIVQQELNLIPTLSIADNLLLTRLPATAGVVNPRALHEKARVALDRVGLSALPTEAKVSSLGVGQQQMVEIAAALDRQCCLLILDEPTAALSAAESETLFEWLGQLRASGVGIVYISHRLDEVKRLSDRITVLRDGQHIGTHDAQNVTIDQMVGLMSGETTARLPDGKPTGSPADVILRVHQLSGGPVKDVSFEVRRGEKLGIAGLVGSGRTELLRLIFGADLATKGGVCIDGETGFQKFGHPSAAVAAGLAMVTEDRKENGLLLSQSVRFNTTLASLWHRFVSFGMLRRSDEEAATAEQCESLEVRLQSSQQRVGTLSGGNQQKVAIAKWLVRDADVFLFDEPTRGIDVAARRRIYRLLDGLAEQGKGIVIVSSDLDELLETCDRIAVMSNGRLVETFTRDDWSHQRIMQAAFSGYLDRRIA